VLWEALVGKPLWVGDSIRAILRAQLEKTAPGIRSANPHAQVPPALDELVMRMIARKPEERPASALEVRNELQKILRGASAPPKPARASSGARQVWMVLFSMLAAGTVLGSVIALAPSKSATVSELQPSIQALIESAAPAAREAAAQRLLQPGTSPPAYAKELARLELGRSCSEKRSALRAALELHDERLTPALRRLSSEPVTGCGPRKDQDCLGCLRRELRASLSSEQ